MVRLKRVVVAAEVVAEAPSVNAVVAVAEPNAAVVNVVVLNAAAAIGNGAAEIAAVVAVAVVAAQGAVSRTSRTVLRGPLPLTATLRRLRPTAAPLRSELT